jgi:oligopeptide/dipeptide ABC transporter ATP-binding protein
MLITHDLGVVAEMAHRVVIIYAGRIVEVAPVVDLFSSPFHPYTRGLLKSIPRLDDDLDRLDIIPGTIPNPTAFPDGCRFCPRCDVSVEQCEQEDFSMVSIEPGRWVRCWHANSEERVKAHVANTKAGQ